MNKLTFLLDLDGVCCEWYRSVAKLLDLDPDKLQHKVGQESPELFDIERDSIWAAIRATKGDLWVNLEPYPWLYDLYDGLKKHGNVCFSTSPGKDPYGLTGKALWIEKHFAERVPNFMRKLMVGFPKELLAGNPAFNRRILVDDSPKQCEEFRGQGGTAILFPQPWSVEDVPEDRVGYVLHEVNKLLCY